ncbi:hypothetical protein PND17_09650 [Streptococcus thermophilus]|uniref:hypothetical protein n=1 Tax=Streptococcus thermophilus TaxID=1308 RepID=UPI00234AB50F|nr:hypothetical protein [Streptococcus thermophilus]WCL60252.1 hypothetical protein PND17_09650 [Streptococcus thermophilus]
MTYLTPLVVGQFAYLTERERQELLVNYRQYLTAPRPGHLADQAAWLASRLRKALELAGELTPTNGVIIVTGSCYLIKELEEGLNDESLDR